MGEHPLVLPLFQSTIAVITDAAADFLAEEFLQKCGRHNAPENLTNWFAFCFSPDFLPFYYGTCWIFSRSLERPLLNGHMMSWVSANCSFQHQITGALLRPQRVQTAWVPHPITSSPTKMKTGRTAMSILKHCVGVTLLWCCFASGGPGAPHKIDRRTVGLCGNKYGQKNICMKFNLGHNWIFQMDRHRLPPDWVKVFGVSINPDQNPIEL